VVAVPRRQGGGGRVAGGASAWHYGRKQQPCQTVGTT
jgi:hypothetical protein